MFSNILPILSQKQSKNNPEKWKNNPKNDPSQFQKSHKKDKLEFIRSDYFLQLHQIFDK